MCDVAHFSARSHGSPWECIPGEKLGGSRGRSPSHTNFVTLSEREESPLMRTASRINADPSLTLRMTKKEKRDDRSDVQDDRSDAQYDLDRGPRRGTI